MSVARPGADGRRGAQGSGPAIPVAVVARATSGETGTVTDDDRTGAQRGPRTAVVLAGGGFKGAFELGALRHLAEHHDVVPDVITATSAGAILGVVAAQARTRDELLVRLDEADADLMSMTRIDVVFGEQPWFRELDGTAAADQIRRMLTQGGPPADGADGPEAGTHAGRQAGRHDRSHDRSHDERHRGPGAAGGHPFTDAVEFVRRLPRAHRAGNDHTDGGILNLDPFEASLRGGTDVGVAPVDPALVARDGLELRLATTHLRSRTTHYVTQDAVLVDSDARTPVEGAGSFDLVDGLIASASVPGVFPPRVLGSTEYVDGGVLANIPLAAAAALEPDRILTLAASPVRAPDHPAAVRVAEQLGYLATQVDNLATPLPDGTVHTVIQPTMLVVGTFEVHPGRMRIDIDYGWLRAQETVAGLDDGTRPILTTTSDTIIRLRQRAWSIENRLIERRDAADLSDLRATKAAIGSALVARSALGFPGPDGSEVWRHGWELHTRPVPDDLPASFD